MLLFILMFRKVILKTALDRKGNQFFNILKLSEFIVYLSIILSC